MFLFPFGGIWIRSLGTVSAHDLAVFIVSISGGYQQAIHQALPGDGTDGTDG